MKKLLALLLAVLMVLGLAACGSKTEAEPSETEQNSSTETTEPVIEGDPAEYSMDYWAEKYPGENICPFTIEENGTEKNYYWVSSIEGWDGTMQSWINQPFNWNGWHKTADGCIVNKDETLKITDNWAEGEAMSSYCTVTTEPYKAAASADTTAAKSTAETYAVKDVFYVDSVSDESASAVIKIAAAVDLSDTSAWLGLCPAGKTYVTEAEADDVDLIYFAYDGREEGAPYVFNCDFGSVEDGTYALVVTSSDDAEVGYVVMQLAMTKSGGKLTFDYADAVLNERPAD